MGLSFTVKVLNSEYLVQLIRLQEVDGFIESQILLECRTVTLRRVGQGKWALKNDSLSFVDGLIDEIGNSIAKFYYV